MAILSFFISTIFNKKRSAVPANLTKSLSDYTELQRVTNHSYGDDEKPDDACKSSFLLKCPAILNNNLITTSELVE